MRPLIQFSKLFIKVHEGEEYMPSIVAYAKEPYEERQDLIKGKQVRKITKYRYFLYINLWLVSFKFIWLQKT